MSIPPLHEEVEVIPIRQSLSSLTLSSLVADFNAMGHFPTTDMMEGLSHVAETLEAMTEGRAPQHFHLSSLDPGVGKTTLLRHFVQHLLGSSDHDHVSVMVCLSRKEEIRRLVEGLDGHLDEVGVFTSDDDLNSLVDTKAQDARVLLTTQQMVETWLQGRNSFEELEVFHYQGHPREVRIWDETILPGKVVSLSADEVAKLIEPCRRVSSILGKGIEGLHEDLKATGPGHRLNIPRLEDLGGLAAEQGLEELARGASDTLKAPLEALFHMAGKKIPVRSSSYGVNTLLDYRDTLPSDLAPIVILDASGRLRDTYRMWEERRGGLKRLRSASKCYSNLNVRVWKRGGGKTSFARNREVLLQGIVNTIARKKDEDWLVVHHKDAPGQDFKADLLAQIPPDLWHHMHFLHWGNHHGVNDFAHIGNVILAGTLFLPEFAYEGLARLSSGLPHDDKVDEALLRKVAIGEHGHAMLQALSRAAVRVTQADGTCKPCNAYVIASARSGIANSLPEVFPGCRMGTWRPLTGRPKGKVKAAIDYIERIFGEGLHDHLTFKELREAIGIFDKSNFRKTIRNHPDFRQALMDMDIEEVAVNGSKHRNAIAPTENPFVNEETSTYVPNEWDLL